MPCFPRQATRVLGICGHTIFLGLSWAHCEAQLSEAGVCKIILLLYHTSSGRALIKKLPQTFPKSPGLDILLWLVQGWCAVGYGNLCTNLSTKNNCPVKELSCLLLHQWLLACWEQRSLCSGPWATREKSITCFTPSDITASREVVGRPRIHTPGPES